MVWKHARFSDGSFKSAEESSVLMATAMGDDDDDEDGLRNPLARSYECATEGSGRAGTSCGADHKESLTTSSADLWRICPTRDGGDGRHRMCAVPLRLNADRPLL